MPLNFNDSGSAIQSSGKETQTIEGNLVLSSQNGANMTFENSQSSGSVGITEAGDLSLSAEGGDVVVAMPDGSNENAVVNVGYVQNVVGNIEDVLETI